MAPQSQPVVCSASSIPTTWGSENSSLAAGKLSAPASLPSTSVATSSLYSYPTVGTPSAVTSTSGAMSSLPPDIAAKANAASQQYIQYYQVILMCIRP